VNEFAASRGWGRIWGGAFDTPVKAPPRFLNRVCAGVLGEARRRNRDGGPPRAAVPLSRRRRTMVYLLHLSQKLSHSQHYLGYADDLDARLERHANGAGARMLAVCRERGISWTLARTWQGNRSFERWLKRKKGAAWFCPVCAGAKALNRAKEKNL
jgi:predicted GIY-YIG superfamily endonuclease